MKLPRNRIISTVTSLTEIPEPRQSPQSLPDENDEKVLRLTAERVLETALFDLWLEQCSLSVKGASESNHGAPLNNSRFKIPGHPHR